MSSLSIHRQRDRGGGSTGTKAVTPNSVSYKNPSPGLKKSSSGKENPKPITRSQKPVIKSVPRVEKAAVESGDSRIRRSTSSAPRGRSQSPSEFIRVYSDLKKDRVSRVSVERKGSRDSSVKGAELGFNEKRGFSELKSDKERKLSGVGFLGSNYNKGVNLGSILGKSSGISVTSNFVSRNEKRSLDVGLKVEKYDKVDVLNSENRLEKIDRSVGLGLNESDEKISRDSKVSETLKEKSLSEEGLSTKVGVKFPSKLHEKLTFLEGKVKRIQSDIKRTKEMLDMNNPDATKLILSDIQEKISGIEKAMGNVAGDSGVKIVGSKGVGKNVEGSKIVEMSQDKIVDGVKGLVKGLKSEELEARLFPHHKLLRNRTSKPASESSQSDELNDEGARSDLKVEEKLLSPIEENPIALQFLASLSKDENKVSAKSGLVDLECDEVLETDEAAKSGEKGLSGMFSGKGEAELELTSDERLDEFDDQENRQAFVIDEGIEDTCTYQLNEIGQRTSTGGWFVSEGESVLLAHDDGSCSYYDITNCEVRILVPF